MPVKEENSLEAKLQQTPEQRAADPLRKQFARDLPEGYARVWFHPSVNIRGAAYRDIDTNAMIRRINKDGSEEEVTELSLYRKKLANPHEMNVHSIVMPDGGIIELGTPLDEDKGRRGRPKADES